MALKAIANEVVDFPKGAFFGKIAWRASPDEVFPNSLEPTSISRFQIMSRDSNRYAATQGWGYAIFNEDGSRVTGNDHSLAMACAACHEYASKRGFVFLGTMDASVNRLKVMLRSSVNETVKAVPPLPLGLVDSKKTLRQEAPQQLLRYLPTGISNLTRIGSKISDRVFIGTVSEMLPLLVVGVKSTGETTAFWSDDGQHWAFAVKELDLSCKRPNNEIGTPVRVLRAIPSTAASAKKRGLSMTSFEESRQCV